MWMIPFSFFGIWVLTKARCLDAQTVRSLADAICRIEKDQTCMDDLARARHFACHGQIYRGAGGLRRGGRPGRARPRRSDDRILGGAPDGPLSRASHYSPRGRCIRPCGNQHRVDGVGRPKFVSTQAFATATVVGAIEGVCRDMLKSADVVPNLLLLFPPAPAATIPTAKRE